MTSLFVDNPQLWFTINPPWPSGINLRPRIVTGVAMLDKYLCVVYFGYDKVCVFSCKGDFKKTKKIKVNGMRCTGMVGCSATSKLFISDLENETILRVDVDSGASDVFIKFGDLDYWGAELSLFKNRLLVRSLNSLLVYDSKSGQRIENIPLTGNVKKHIFFHAIESNRNTFFVIHIQTDCGPSTISEMIFVYQLGRRPQLELRPYTVSEIDSEGRVIRVFDNKQQLYCVHLALDSVGRLFATDRKNSCFNNVVLFAEHLTYERILIDKKRLDNSYPMRLNYNKSNNRLAVGLGNGLVKIFEF
jgi:hypothetical protein